MKMPDCRATEKVHADLHRLLDMQKFDSVEEVNRFLQETLGKTGGKVPVMPPETPLDQAQDVMYEAWGTKSPKKRCQLARKALAISSDCADAYVLLAEEEAKSCEDARNFFQKGVEAGERALGKEAFKDFEGHFWGHIVPVPTCERVAD